jgi:hypothetical protein
MAQFLNRIGVSRRLQLISLSFSLPIVVMIWLIVKGINTSIDFAQWEKYGNAYQRPLEALLEYLPQHRLLLEGAAGTGGTQVKNAISEVQGQIDAAFEQLEQVDGRRGRDLQFTEEGLVWALSIRDGKIISIT